MAARMFARGLGTVAIGAAVCAIEVGRRVAKVDLDVDNWLGGQMLTPRAPGSGDDESTADRLASISPIPPRIDSPPVTRPAAEAG